MHSKLVVKKTNSTIIQGIRFWKTKFLKQDLKSQIVSKQNLKKDEKEINIVIYQENLLYMSQIYDMMLISKQF